LQPSSDVLCLAGGELVLFVEDELLGGSQQPCNGRSLGSRVGEQRFVARMEAGLGESGTSLMDSVKEGADSFLVEAARWRDRGNPLLSLA